MELDETTVAERPTAGSYRFTFDRYPRRVRAVVQGLTLADSARVCIMRETRLAPVYYFPRQDVRMDLMQRTDYVSHCPFKGNAAHYSLRAGERVAENVMWSYEEPIEDSSAIAGYVALYADQVDAWFEDESEVRTASPADAGEYANPLLGWLIREAPQLVTSRELTGELARRMRAAGIPVWRLFVAIRTLHPQVAAYSYRWWSRTGEVEAFEASYRQLESAAFQNSPMKPILEGAGGIRRRLDTPDPVLDFDILADLHAEGATDYVAMPMPFSDDQLNVLTLTTDRPGGFSTADLGHVYEILAVLGRLYEVQALHRKAATLLDTYVGPHAGERVLHGRIKRGDGETIQAVIWFCDLRDSTPLAQSLGREAFLATLNEFFDGMAGAVIDHGGQVLRFIGDAALAIFPFEGDAEPGRPLPAHERALAAIDDARGRLAETNRRRTELGARPLGFGVALHEGEVTYGNIGTSTRLEFTVIGDAANRAARVESLCKTLGEEALVSAEVAARFPGRFDSVGLHEIRGVDGCHEIFAVR